MRSTKITGNISITGNYSLPAQYKPTASSITDGLIESVKDHQWTVNNFPSEAVSESEFIQIQNMLYGNGVYMATTAGPYIYSSDGKTWTEYNVSSYFSDCGNVVASGFFDDVFVLITDKGYSLYSHDALRWNKSTNMIDMPDEFNVSFGSMAYDHERKFYVLVLTNGEVSYAWTSRNGIDWTATMKDGDRLNIGKCVKRICYSHGVFFGGECELSDGKCGVAVGLYNDDGNSLAWKHVGEFDKGDYSVPVYGANKFMIFRDDVSGKYIFSYDGVIWHERELPNGFRITDAMFVDGKFVLMSGYNESNGNYVLESVDGVEWSTNSIDVSPISEDEDDKNKFYSHVCWNGHDLLSLGCWKYKLSSNDNEKRYYTITGKPSGSQTVNINSSLSTVNNKSGFKCAQQTIDTGLFKRNVVPCILRDDINKVMWFGTTAEGVSRSGNGTNDYESRNDIVKVPMVNGVLDYAKAQVYSSNIFSGVANRAQMIKIAQNDDGNVLLAVSDGTYPYKVGENVYCYQFAYSEDGGDTWQTGNFPEDSEGDVKYFKTKRTISGKEYLICYNLRGATFKNGKFVLVTYAYTGDPFGDYCYADETYYCLGEYNTSTGWSWTYNKFPSTGENVTQYMWSDMIQANEYFITFDSGSLIAVGKPTYDDKGILNDISWTIDTIAGITFNTLSFLSKRNIICASVTYSGRNRVVSFEVVEEKTSEKTSYHLNKLFEGNYDRVIKAMVYNEKEEILCGISAAVEVAKQSILGVKCFTCDVVFSQDGINFKVVTANYYIPEEIYNMYNPPPYCQFRSAECYGNYYVFGSQFQVDYDGVPLLVCSNGETTALEKSIRNETTINKYTSKLSISKTSGWQKSANFFDYLTPRCVCYGNGKFVVSSDNDDYRRPEYDNAIAYSYDGIHWKKSTINEGTYDGRWMSVCYGNGKFVAARFSSNACVAYSYDGIDWHCVEIQMGVISGSKDLWSVCYGNGKFVAVGCGNLNTWVLNSDDGIVWTVYPYVMPNPQTYISGNKRRRVFYGGGKFVCIFADGMSKNACYSYDGMKWYMTEFTEFTRWERVCYGEDKFVAVSLFSNESTYYQLTDGKFNGTYDCKLITKSNGGYVQRKYRSFDSSTDNGKTRYKLTSVEWYELNDAGNYMYDQTSHKYIEKNETSSGPYYTKYNYDVLSINTSGGYVIDNGANKDCYAETTAIGGETRYSIVYTKNTKKRGGYEHYYTNVMNYSYDGINWQ